MKDYWFLAFVRVVQMSVCVRKSVRRENKTIRTNYALADRSAPTPSRSPVRNVGTPMCPLVRPSALFLPLDPRESATTPFSIGPAARRGPTVRLQRRWWRQPRSTLTLAETGTHTPTHSHASLDLPLYVYFYSS